MFSSFVEGELRRVAATRALAADALLAAAEVLGGGPALVEINGRLAPPIDWAPHVFHRRLRPEARAAAVRAGLAAERREPRAAPRSQRERHALLARAALIDREAAHAACAWGVGRAPGEAARRIGFESAEAMGQAAWAGVAGQARVLLGYVEAIGLEAALRARDWAAFAAGYCAGGEPAAMAAALAAAEARWSARPPSGDAVAPLATGARGAAVARLQRALRARGAAVAVDGRFGPETRRALRAWQACEGLVADGVAGARTLDALRRPAPARAGDDGEAAA